MAHTADDVADRLVAAGVGAAGTTIFVGRLPHTPDTALYIRQMGGRIAARGFGENNAPIAEFPDVQIIVRGVTYPTRDTLSLAVRGALDFKTWTVGGNEYFSQLQYEPIDLGEDENQRPQVSMVFRLVRR